MGGDLYSHLPTLKGYVKIFLRFVISTFLSLYLVKMAFMCNVNIKKRGPLLSLFEYLKATKI